MIEEACRRPSRIKKNLHDVLLARAKVARILPRSNGEKMFEPMGLSGRLRKPHDHRCSPRWIVVIGGAKRPKQSILCCIWIASSLPLSRNDE